MSGGTDSAHRCICRTYLRPVLMLSGISRRQPYNTLDSAIPTFKRVEIVSRETRGNRDQYQAGCEPTPSHAVKISGTSA